MKFWDFRFSILGKVLGLGHSLGFMLRFWVKAQVLGFKFFHITKWMQVLRLGWSGA
jgi:hypothetical protein